ncbi:hypothetical protein BsWGS_23173 [Bradybaena similaris]
MNDYSYRMPAQICCPYHPEAILVEDYHAGDMICPECGLVVGDRIIDVTAEWRTFDEKEDKSRVGAAENPLLEVHDMSTKIDNYSLRTQLKDESGRFLYKNRNSSYIHANGCLKAAFRDIAEMAERLNVPRMLVDSTCRLYKDAHKFLVVKAYSQNAVIAACMYIACRQEGVPQTFKEICAVSRVNHKEIGHVFNKIVEHLKLSIIRMTSGDFMSRFCCNLRLSNATQKAASYIATKAGEMGLVFGWCPITVAATAIYIASLASGEKKTTEEIVEVSGVHPHGIRKLYTRFRPNAAALFPADFKFSSPVEKLPKH